MAAKYQRIPFNPFTYPTILEDEEAGPKERYSEKLQYLASAVLIGLVTCLAYNAVANSVQWALVGQATTSFFLSHAYYVLGSQLAYVTWYKSLTDALSTGNATSFRSFFSFFLLHIGFCIFAGVGCPIPPDHGWSFTGVLSAMEVYREDTMVGIFYFFGFGLFCVESMLSLYLQQRVWLYYRLNSLDLEMK